MSTDAAADDISKRTQQPMLASQRAKLEQQQKAAEGQAPPKNRMSGWFPMGYMQAAQEWWSSVTPTVAERNVLARIPVIKEAISGELDKSDPFGPRVWRSSMVQLSGKNRALNEFCVERVGEDVDNTLVMLHGYGAGLGLYFQNFEPLSRVSGLRLYALDMLGMGNSSRPPFKIHAKDPQGKITEAENWFVDSLEEWRKARKIEKFTLLGHSLGGYVAVSYALKYPGRLNKLILASPVGVPEDPYAVNADMPEPGESTMMNEFTQDQESVVEATTKAAQADNNNFFNARDRKEKANGKATAGGNVKPEKRPQPAWLLYLWDANVSPFSLVRLAGPLGPKVVSGWTTRRFSHLPPEEAQTMHSYAYALFRQRGSGEYALPYILAPGAFARSPIINRIQNVGRGVIQPKTETTPEVRETGFPIVFLYGDNDWMDVAGGYAAEEKLKQRSIQALLHGTDEEKRRENGSAKVVIVNGAGHNVHLDSPANFNRAVMKELELTREEILKQRASK